jgi:hypothetical protein
MPTPSDKLFRQPHRRPRDADRGTPGSSGTPFRRPGETVSRGGQPRADGPTAASPEPTGRGNPIGIIAFGIIRIRSNPETGRGGLCLRFLGQAGRDYADGFAE